MALARSIATVGLLTLLSRLLGFVRDLLTAVMLGAGPVADAFVAAQRLPNALRAIFAEGAMDTAFVPIYARKRRQETPEKTAEFVSHIFTMLVAVLLPLTILAIVFMPTVMKVITPGFSETSESFQLAVTYSRIVFAFLFLISVSALQGSLLNACGHFAPLAAAPAVLNIIMIGGFGYAWLFHRDAGLCGSWSMIVGGIVQMVMLQIVCLRYGLKMRFAWPRLTSDVRQFFKLVGPGVVGVGAVQLNMLVATMLASSLPAGAIAAIYYADRLIQLPLGVIGGAISTTLLPTLTHHLAAKEHNHVTGHFSRALEIGLFLCLPAAAILMMVPDTITRILYQHGAFNADDTRVTGECIAAFSLIIPFSILARIFSTRFYAHEDTKTPVMVAIMATSANAVAAWLLRGPLQHIGIALGLALCAIVYASLLWYFLHRRGQTRIDAKAKKRLPCLVLAMTIMGVVLWFIAPLIDGLGMRYVHAHLLRDCIDLGLEVALSGAVYLAVLHISGAIKLGDLRALRRNT